jgi:Flp pilus assembly pilin Flp
MIHTLKLVKDTIKTDQRGVTAVEYALVAGALVAGIALAIGALTGTLQTFFTNLTL